MISEEGVAAVAALSPPVDLPEGLVIEGETAGDVEAWTEDALADQLEVGALPELAEGGTRQASLAFDEPEPEPEPFDGDGNGDGGAQRQPAAMADAGQCVSLRERPQIRPRRLPPTSRPKLRPTRPPRPTRQPTTAWS